MTQEVKDQQEILKLQKIDCLVKALGTMVMMPNYEKDPTEIGKRHFAGTIQQPILMDSDRTDAIEKLKTIIKSL